MRVPVFLLTALVVWAEPFRWTDMRFELAQLLIEAELTPEGFPRWLSKHDATVQERLAAGAAEHIAYYLLQTTELKSGPVLDPVEEAKRYFGSLPGAEKAAFLNGKVAITPFAAPVHRRMEAFRREKPVSERHRILREMAARLDWPDARVVQTAFRFLIRRSDDDDADALYQARGLSADPFPATMKAVDRGLGLVKSHDAVLLIGPGAELGSRFGLDDSLPVISPQATALLARLGGKPSIYDCVDVRPEVAQTLAAGPCSGSTLDVVSKRLPAARYDLAVATNVFVYLDERELGVALANVARSLRPGGCLLHNDSRFAARLFGEGAGIPVKGYESVIIGSRGGREQRDRIVVHCKPLTSPI